MNRIHVIGVSENLNELDQLPQGVLDDCTLVVSATRHHIQLKSINKNLQDITPLKDVLKSIETALAVGNVAILGSGDPLFFGIGSTLLKHFREDVLIFHPTISSVQRACSLFKTSWHDAQLRSLHGRKHTHVPALFLPNKKTIALTDRTNSPSYIAKIILEYLELIDAKTLACNIRCYVAEELGTENEHVFTGTLEETASKCFSTLNVFCLINTDALNNTFRFGLTEDDITHSRGLITKNEVRAASLHQLQLPKQGVLWDVGGGSGSISVEASRLAPKLTIYCIEHKEEELENIRKNIRKHGCYNIIPVFGNAAEKLPELPFPDRVFIGGSGGKLETIINMSAERLPVGGRIVVNSVLQKTTEETPLFMAKNQLMISSSTISVSRKKGADNQQDFNPITITTGIKHEQ